MQQLILKKDIPQSKLDALISFLKSWGIEVELKSSGRKAKTHISEVTLMSEQALAEAWDSEEDERWDKIYNLK